MWRSCPVCVARLVSIFIVSFFVLSRLEADDAFVLPKEVYRLKLKYKIGNVDSRFGDNYKQTSLSDLIIDQLSDAGIPAFRDGEYKLIASGSGPYHLIEWQLEYGLTEKISIGLNMAYYIKQKQKLSVNLEKYANWDASPYRGFVEAGIATIEDMNAEGVGITDSLFGYKHQVWGANSEPFRVAYLLGVRAPTGRSSPMNKNDMVTGDGQWDIGLWLSVDYEFSKSFTMNYHSRHEYGFEGEKKVLDPHNSKRFISMRFRPGFYNYFEIEPRFAFGVGRVELLFDMPFVCEYETNTREQRYRDAEEIYKGGLSKVNETDFVFIKTMPHFGVSLLKLGIPLIVYMEYQAPLAGKNIYNWWHVQLTVVTFAKF